MSTSARWWWRTGPPTTRRCSSGQRKGTWLDPVGDQTTLSEFLSDFWDAIDVDPIRPPRRGRRRHDQRPKKKVWAEPVELLEVADQIAACYGPSGAILEVTAGWTGARWGELTGLQRRNVHLFDDDTGFIVIEPDTGTLHESASGQMWLGPPKTEASARTISLVPFNVRLLRVQLASHNHPHVFIGPDGGLLRRSTFSRRAQRPAADGNLHVDNPGIRLHPVKPGLTFHGTRRHVTSRSTPANTR